MIFATVSSIINDANPATKFNKPGGGINVSTISDLLNNGGFKITNFVIYIVGMLFFFNIILAGWEYLTSSGDPKKFANATTRFINGLWGMVFVISAWLIVRIITAIIGQPNLLL